jgi:hypothetical protein
MKTLPALLLVAGLLAAGCATSHDTADSPRPEPTGLSPATKLLIITAAYGSGVQYAEVTARVDELLHKSDGDFWANPKWLGVDPTPGWNKALVIIYEFKGQRHTITRSEGWKVNTAILEAAAEHRLSGQVVDNRGVPIAGVWVNMSGRGQPLNANTKTDGAGHFAFQNVGDGWAILTAYLRPPGLPEIENPAGSVRAVAGDVNKILTLGVNLTEDEAGLR